MHAFKLIFARIRWTWKRVVNAYWTMKILAKKEGLDQARKIYHDQLIERERVDSNSAATNKLRGKVEILDELLDLPYN